MGRRQLLLAVPMVLAVVTAVSAAPPADTLFPATTKGYISVIDFQELSEQFGATQLSAMMKNEKVKPFAEDLRKQLQSKLSGANVRLGVTWDDFKGVADGELAMGILQPGKAGTHAVLLTVDIGKNLDAAKELLKKLSKRVTNEGGKAATVKSGELTLTQLTLPANKDRKVTRQAYYLIHDDLLIASDDKSVAVGSIKSREKSISGVEAYQRASVKAFPGNKDIQVRWFIEPLGYADLMLASDPNRGDGSILKILREEGFEAIQGMGGVLGFAVGDYEMLHRIRIVTSDKLEKSARMLNFPNSDAPLQPETWVPHDVASYVTLNWKMKEAFDFSIPMVNKLLNAEPGENLVKEIIDGIAKDPFGPKVDIEKEIIKHFDDRATWITNYKEPITPESQRWAVAIRVSNLDVVKKAIEKVMKSEPTAFKREVGDGKYQIWEVLEEEADVEEVKIGGLDLEGDDQDDQPKKPGLISTFALTVVKEPGRNLSHIIVSSHVDFLEKLLTSKSKEKLAAQADYVAVDNELKKLGMAKQSVRQFNRLDRVYRISYELMKQGKMPESKTLFGKLLNRSMTEDTGELEEPKKRKQQINGEKMPDFSVVAPYLGPAGFTLKSEKDGWSIISVLLKK